MLDVDGLHVAFADREVLHDVSLQVATSEIVALIGPSGSGKSTLLRAIAGLVAPSAGMIRLDGRDITAEPTHRRRVGMVFQDEQLFPHLSVAANVGFGLQIAGVERSQRDAEVARLLDVVGLPDFGRRQIGGLSGGERKRVAVARALAPRPRVLLLDEPLTGLDQSLHDRLADEIPAILREADTAAIWVTHDRDEAAIAADRVLSLDVVEHGGRLVPEGP